MSYPLQYFLYYDRCLLNIGWIADYYFATQKYFNIERNILHSSSEETVRNSLHGSGTGQWQISIAGIQIGNENISFSLEWTWKHCDWEKNRNNSQTEWKMVIVIDWVPMCHWKWFLQCHWKEIYARANRFRFFFFKLKMFSFSVCDCPLTMWRNFASLFCEF